MTRTAARAPRFVLDREATFRVIDADVAEVVVAGGQRVLVPTDICRLLLELATPRTLASLHATVADDLPLEALEMLLNGYVEAGVISRVDSRGSAPSGRSRDPQFAELFRRGVFDDRATIRALQTHLRDGRAVVIPDALDTAVAEAMHAELVASDSWRVYFHSTEHFHFHHRNIYEPEHFPPMLTKLARIFASDEAKQTIAKLSGADCDGTIDIGASLYLPGDHSLPHDDSHGSHSVAFIWHLTTEWSADWGGDLFWAPSGTHIPPRFNSLTLFNVSPASMHCVTQVAPHATGRRLTVNGWWSRSDSSVRREVPTGISSLASAPRYGKPHEAVGRTGIIAI